MPGTSGLVERSGLDPMNARSVHLLIDLRPEARWLLAAAIVAMVNVIAALVRQERAVGPRANPAKWLYQISSLALVASIVVDPADGFIAYISAHSIEYAVIVYRTAERRYSAGGGQPPRSSRADCTEAPDVFRRHRRRRVRGARPCAWPGFQRRLVLGGRAVLHFRRRHLEAEAAGGHARFRRAIGNREGQVVGQAKVLVFDSAVVALSDHGITMPEARWRSICTLSQPRGDHRKGNSGRPWWVQGLRRPSCLSFSCTRDKARPERNRSRP
jgi:hypothetical protein